MAQASGLAPHGLGRAPPTSLSRPNSFGSSIAKDGSQKIFGWEQLLSGIALYCRIQRAVRPLTPPDRFNRRGSREATSADPHEAKKYSGKALEFSGEMSIRISEKASRLPLPSE